MNEKTQPDKHHFFNGQDEICECGEHLYSNVHLVDRILYDSEREIIDKVAESMTPKDKELYLSKFIDL